MQYRSVKGFTGMGMLGMLLLFLGIGFIIAAIVQVAIGMMMLPAGMPLDKMGEGILKAMLDPKNVTLARISQVLGTLFLLFIPAWLYSLVVNGKNMFWLGFNKYVSLAQVVLGFFLIFLAGIAAAPLGDWTKSIVSHYPAFNAWAANLEKMYTEQAMALSNLRSWPEFLVAIAIMAFFPAMFEEVFFRGALQQLFTKWWKNPILAIIVTSILFSLIHSSVYLFLSRAILGIVLGWMFYITKNIWVNIIAHFINNFLALTQMFYMFKTNQKVDLDKMDMQFGWIAAAGALIALVVLFRLLEKYSVKNRLKIDAREAVLLAKANPFLHFDKPQNDPGIGTA